MMKFVLLLYLIVVAGLSFILPSWRVYKRTGVNPFTFSNSDSAHDFVGRIFKMVFGTYLTVGILTFSGWQDALDWLHPLTLPYWTAGAGIALLFLALIWISVAQMHMSDSWRIGIDEKNDTALVTHGLFAWSRNPIFLGMQATLLGLFLLMPNLVTAVAGVVGWLSVQVQVRLEEEFLSRKHGNAYHQYCEKVRRWI